MPQQITQFLRTKDRGTSRIVHCPVVLTFWQPPNYKETAQLPLQVSLEDILKEVQDA